MTHNIADDTGVRVCRVLCPTCIFRPGNLMRLTKGRVRGMVEEARSQDGGTIVCHDTLDDDRQAICRGFYDRYKDDVPLLQIAERLGAIVEYDRNPS